MHFSSPQTIAEEEDVPQTRLGHVTMWFECIHGVVLYYLADTCGDGGCLWCRGQPADGKKQNICRCFFCYYLFTSNNFDICFIFWQCSAQAFFAQFSLSTVMYNASLAIYYVMVVVKNRKDADIVRIEPFLHLNSILWGLGTALASLALTVRYIGRYSSY